MNGEKFLIFWLAYLGWSPAKFIYKFSRTQFAYKVNYQLSASSLTRIMKAKTKRGF